MNAKYIQVSLFQISKRTTEQSGRCNSVDPLEKLSSISSYLATGQHCHHILKLQIPPPSYFDAFEIIIRFANVVPMLHNSCLSPF